MWTLIDHEKWLGGTNNSHVRHRHVLISFRNVLDFFFEPAFFGHFCAVIAVFCLFIVCVSIGSMSLKPFDRTLKKSIKNVRNVIEFRCFFSLSLRYIVSKVIYLMRLCTCVSFFFRTRLPINNQTDFCYKNGHSF